MVKTSSSTVHTKAISEQTNIFNGSLTFDRFSIKFKQCSAYKEPLSYCCLVVFLSQIDEISKNSEIFHPWKLRTTDIPTIKTNNSCQWEALQLSMRGLCRCHQGCLQLSMRDFAAVNKRLCSCQWEALWLIMRGLFSCQWGALQLSTRWYAAVNLAASVDIRLKRKQGNKQHCIIPVQYCAKQRNYILVQGLRAEVVIAPTLTGWHRPLPDWSASK